MDPVGGARAGGAPRIRQCVPYWKRFTSTIEHGHVLQKNQIRALMYFIGDLSAVHLALHYGISNHVHHSCLLLSYINVIMQMSCSEEFQGISFFYNYETQKLTKVFTCSVQINAALIVPFT